MGKTRRQHCNIYPKPGKKKKKEKENGPSSGIQSA